MTIRDTVLAHSRQCPCIHHDPHSHQCLHNLKPLEAALTAEEPPERSASIRHVSRPHRPQCSSASRLTAGELAWWGWPGLVAATGNPYPTAYGYYPAYAYGYGTGYGYPASRYYSSSGGYGMWENPWYSAAYQPVIRRHIVSRPRIRPIYATGAGVRRHWQ
jgi:hypothetical protein